MLELFSKACRVCNISGGSPKGCAGAGNRPRPTNRLLAWRELDRKERTTWLAGESAGSRGVPRGPTESLPHRRPRCQAHMAQTVQKISRRYTSEGFLELTKHAHTAPRQLNLQLRSRRSLDFRRHAQVFAHLGPLYESSARWSDFELLRFRADPRLGGLDRVPWHLTVADTRPPSPQRSHLVVALTWPLA